MSADRSLPVGVVVERREIDNPWVDYTWRPVAVVPGAPAVDSSSEWKILGEGDGWTHFHAATLELELFKGETDGYRTNLSNVQPYIYIVLNPGEEADDPEVLPVLVTACPYEAESYTEDSEQIVEGVPMPEDLAIWINDFVKEFHIDRPFKKRKRKPYDPRKGEMGGGQPLINGRAGTRH